MSRFSISNNRLDLAANKAFAAIMAEHRAARVRDLERATARDARERRGRTVRMAVLVIVSFLAGILFHGGIR